MYFTFGSTRLRITHPTWDSLLSECRSRLSARKGFALATVNLDHLVKLRSEPEFRAAYAKQDIIVADGNPVVWLHKLAGETVELIPGSDAIVPLVRVASDEEVTLALVGSSDDTLEAAARYLETEVTGAKVVCKISPPYGFNPDGTAARDVLEQVRESGAGLCFVAFGAPKGERFSALGRDVAPEVGFVSIGAGLDFFSGAQTRAPAWVRAIALEWLWRAVSSPARLIPRYARCFAILPRLTRDAISQRS